MQTGRGRIDGTPFQQIEEALAEEMIDARNWFRQIEVNEQRWISEGRDVDRHFAAVYYDSLEDTVAAAKKQLEKESAPGPQIEIPVENPWTAPLIGIVVAVILLMVVVIVIVDRRYRKRVSPSGKPHLQSF